MRITFLILALVPFLTSCNPTDDPCFTCIPQDTIPGSPFNVLWRTPLNPDTADCISMQPVVYNGKVVYSILFYVGGYEFLRAVDAASGQPVWAWDPIWPGETLSRGSRFSRENQFVLTHSGPTYCIDLNSGQNIWYNTVNSSNTTGKPYLSRVGDHIYTEHSSKIVLDTASYFVRADINTGIWDTLFVLKSDEGYRPSLFPPSLWVSPIGDSILIFQNRQWNFPASDGRLDMLAYNLRTRSFEWTNKDFDPVGNSNIETPLIHENKVFLQAEKAVYCFDAATGTRLWKWDAPLSGDNLMQANMVVAEGKLYVKPNNDRALYALNLVTGKTVDYIQNAGVGQGILSYHNGILYYASEGDGKIYAIHLTQRRVIWGDKSPTEALPGKWQGDTTCRNLRVSPEHNCVFVADNYFLMAIALPQ